MNERAISVLEQYDVQLLHYSKGRGSLLCETAQGLLILKEFTGRSERILEINPYLKALKEHGFLVEAYRMSRENGYICQDREQKNYVLKDYFEGRECRVSEPSDLEAAFALLGRMQTALKQIGYLSCEVIPEMEDAAGTEEADAMEAADSCRRADAILPSQRSSRLIQDTVKKNRELRRVSKYLRRKENKTAFETFLRENYDIFFRQASETEQIILQQKQELPAFLCHGDFQYHNLLFTEKGIAIINFEKMQYDDASRDLAHLFRKVMEKCGWSIPAAEKVLASYREQYDMSRAEYEQFLLRIRYPEKFRKIVNNYMNSRKMVLFDKSLEKLEKLLAAENDRRKCLDYLSSQADYFCI